MSRNEKKGHGGNHTRPKKWSGARRPAGPATTALIIEAVALGIWYFRVYVWTSYNNPYKPKIGQIWEVEGMVYHSCQVESYILGLT